MSEVRREIEDLLLSMVWAQDHRDNEGFSDYFTEDGVFNTMRVLRGRAEIDKFFVDRHRELGGVGGRGRHLISNLVLLEQGEDKVRAQHVQTIFAGVGAGPFPATPTMIIDVIDDIVKQDGRWLVARRDMATAFGGLPQPAS